MINNRLALIVGGLAVFVWVVWKVFRQPNALEQHLADEKTSQKVGAIAAEAGLDSLANYPWVTLGDAPLAGVIFDPFNKNNPASQPKPLSLYPNIINF